MAYIAGKFAVLENFLYKKSIYAIIGWICGNTEEQDNYMYQRYVMEQYVIKGGNPLSGEVNIIGAKNAALAIIAAAVSYTHLMYLLRKKESLRQRQVMMRQMQAGFQLM